MNKHRTILKSKIGKKPLSERELEIGNFLTVGLTDNEIARKLSIAPDTVKFHLKNIYKKIGVNGRKGLLKKYSINSAKYINLLEKYIALQINPTGTFSYDFKKGISKPSMLTRLIYYMGKDCPFDYRKKVFTFEEVKNIVAPKDRQRFQSTFFDSRKEKKVSTDTIHLVNGNTIVEVYNYIYHSKDYKMESLISIEGETKLVAMAD